MDVEQQRVNWWVVAGGIFITVVTGVFVGALVTVASANVLDRPVAVVTAATIVVGLFYFGLYLLARKRMRDLAMGLLIGGCLAALGTGACGYLLIRLV